jgi:hypothetical protein
MFPRSFVCPMYQEIRNHAATMASTLLSRSKSVRRLAPVWVLDLELIPQLLF